MSMDTSSPTNAVNLAFVESLFEQWQNDPSSVAPEWEATFHVWESETSATPLRVGPSKASKKLFAPSGASVAGDASATRHQHMLDLLVRNYRTLGHVSAKINPLHSDEDLEVVPELQLEHYGFTQQDLKELFYCNTMWMFSSVFNALLSIHLFTCSCLCQ